MSIREPHSPRSELVKRFLTDRDFRTAVVDHLTDKASKAETKAALLEEDVDSLAAVGGKTGETMRAEGRGQRGSPRQTARPAEWTQRPLVINKVIAQNAMLHEAELTEARARRGEVLTTEDQRIIDAANAIRIQRNGRLETAQIEGAEGEPVSLRVYYPSFRSVGGEPRKRGTGRLEAATIMPAWWEDARSPMILDLPERPKPGSLIEVETSGAERGYAYYRVTSIPQEATPDQKKKGLFLKPIKDREFDELKQGIVWDRRIKMKRSIEPPVVYTIRVPQHKRETQTEENVRTLRQPPTPGTVA